MIMAMNYKDFLDETTTDAVDINIDLFLIEDYDDVDFGKVDRVSCRRRTFRGCACGR